VPHGELSTAKEVKALTDSYGIKTAEYGSYYSISQSEPELFEKAAATARTLGTNVIRVWPGKGTPSDSLTNEKYDEFVNDAKRICDLAPDMTIALECHPNSLTDEYHTALQFISDVGKSNLKMLWQPNQHRPIEYNLDAINALLPYIVGVHVFSWVRNKKLPLADGEGSWKKYIKLLSQKNDIHYMLEFMHDDNIETLKETAATLNKWLEDR
jgi:sugar phosphate isomerase/epimerase